MENIEKIVNYLIIGFENLVEWLFGLLNSIPEKNKGYNAEWASESTLLSSSNKGFCLTGTKNLSVKNSYQNALIIGGTGVGKSSVVLLPSLYSMQSSFCVNDPSGELFAKSSGFLAENGYDVKVLNFTKPESSSGYNPIKRANDSSSIQKVASLLVENALGDKTKDPFWNTQAISLISSLIAILNAQPDKEYCNLFNVRQLLNKLSGDSESASGVDTLFSQYADEILFAEYKSFLKMDQKVSSSVIATCKSALQIFNDEAVARVTSFDNIDFQDFRNRPTVLFIQNSTADQKYYSVITSLFFEQFFSYIFSRFPEPAEQDIFFLIDEASSLRLPTLPLACANVRKHRAGIKILCQDFAQIISLYGRDSTGIRSNCFSRMYFTGQSLETCKELSELMGKYEYLDKDEKKQVRSLMLPDEIRTMSSTEAILICGHHLPIKAKLKPYYKSTQYRNYAEIIPPTIISLAPVGPVPILPLTPIHHEEVA